MKHAILPFIILTTSICVKAQVAMLDKVADWIQHRDFDRAEQGIAAAEKHSATAKDPRTYYLKAFLYKEMFLQANDLTRYKLQRHALTNLQRCQQLDTDNNFKLRHDQLHEFITATLFNDATDAFMDAQYVIAANLFKIYIANTQQGSIRIHDAFYFRGLALTQLSHNDSALMHFELLRSVDYQQPDLYVELVHLYQTHAIELADARLQEGLMRFPDDMNLRIAELNLLSFREQYEVLEKRITAFLAHHPSHREVMLMGGTTFEKLLQQTGEKEYFRKAEAIYKSLLAINPHDHEANFNLGVLYYNEAVDIVNKQDLDTDIEVLTKMLEYSASLFSAALPHLLASLTDGPQTLPTYHALQAIYYNLNMKAELREVSEVIQRFTND